MNSRTPKGMSLLELTVTIMVLLSLITVLLIGAKAWKKGSDRAACILNIHYVQKGVRSYANLYGLSIGSSQPGLKDKIIGSGAFVEREPSCTAGGSYSYGQTSGPETIPPAGELYMSCDQDASDRHIPLEYSDW